MDPAIKKAVDEGRAVLISLHEQRAAWPSVPPPKVREVFLDVHTFMKVRTDVRTQVFVDNGKLRFISFLGQEVHEMPRQGAAAYLVGCPIIARAYLAGKMDERALIKILKQQDIIEWRT